MSLLAEILSSKVRAEIFRALFGLNTSELHLRELERYTGCAVGTVQTEMKKLTRLDLVIKRRDGNRLYYRANREHPLYPEIRGMVVKTIGVVDVLREALEKCPEIVIAFVFGSVAAKQEKASSDIDLMVIGSVGLRKVTGILTEKAAMVNREINPHVIEVAEFARRRAEKEHFVMQVLNLPKLFIIGSENELENLA
jgi:predicted nucleotidyltransferase